VDSAVARPSVILQLARPIRAAIALVATVEILSREIPKLEEVVELFLIDLRGIG
jgi:hypothetical protein